MMNIIAGISLVTITTDGYGSNLVYLLRFNKLSLMLTKSNEIRKLCYTKHTSTDKD